MLLLDAPSAGLAGGSPKAGAGGNRAPEFAAASVQSRRASQAAPRHPGRARNVSNFFQDDVSPWKRDGRAASRLPRRVGKSRSPFRGPLNSKSQGRCLHVP